MQLPEKYKENCMADKVFSEKIEEPRQLDFLDWNRLIMVTYCEQGFQKQGTNIFFQTMLFVPLCLYLPFQKQNYRGRGILERNIWLWKPFGSSTSTQKHVLFVRDHLFQKILIMQCSTTRKWRLRKLLYYLGKTTEEYTKIKGTIYFRKFLFRICMHSFRKQIFQVRKWNANLKILVKWLKNAWWGCNFGIVWKLTVKNRMVLEIIGKQ